VPAIDRRLRELRWSVTTTALVAAIDSFGREGASFNAARDAALSKSLNSDRLRHVNQALLLVERALTRPEGLRSRPWFRNLIYASDENNGYANMPLPSINEALRDGDETVTRREIDDLASRFARAGRALADARSALNGG
jgi:N-acetylated-alpha-linked acidic dipeptidase